MVERELVQMLNRIDQLSPDWTASEGYWDDINCCLSNGYKVRIYKGYGGVHITVSGEDNTTIFSRSYTMEREDTDYRGIGQSTFRPGTERDRECGAYLIDWFDPRWKNALEKSRSEQRRKEEDSRNRFFSS
jgi:hypothetical protein